MPPEQNQFNNLINNQVGNQPTNQFLSPQKPKIFLWILLGLLVLAGAFGAWYFVSFYPQTTSDQNEETVSIKKTDEFADWDTYRNEKYGFEIKYPTGWSFDEKFMTLNNSKTFIAFSPNNSERDTILDSGFLNEEGTIKAIIKEDYFAGKKIKYYDCVISNSCSQNVFYEKSIRFLEYPKNWGLRNQISFSIKKGNENDKDVVDRILSTFKFISPVSDISNWKTYKNENRKFEIKYPPSLSAREIYSHNIIVCFEDSKNTLANGLAVCVEDNNSALSPSANSLVFEGGECVGSKGGISTCSYVMNSKNQSLLQQIGNTFKFIK